MSRFRLSVLSLCLFVISGRAPAEAPGEVWQPARTWVFAAGLVEWKDPKWLRFPQKNRSDAELMRALQTWGVPANHLVYLQDAAATKAGIETGLRSFLARPQPGDSLLFYFTGHGIEDSKTGRAYFVPYDGAGDYLSEVSIDAVLDEINRNFRGSQALLVADSCHSGGVVEAIHQQHGSIRYFALASSRKDESSTVAWTFTDALIDAFHGDPFLDHTGDRWIRFADLARFVREEMAFADEQTSDSGVSDAGLETWKLIPVSGRVFPGLGWHVSAEFDGTWYPARVVGMGEGVFRVHWYAESSPVADTWLAIERVKRVQ